MSDLKQTNIRTLVKTLTGAGEVPTVPGSGVTSQYNHTAGGWINTDIYDNEMCTNITDQKVWIRLGDDIVRLGYSGETTDFIDLGDTPSTIQDGRYLIGSGATLAWTDIVIYDTIQTLNDWDYGVITSANTGQSIVVNGSGTGFTLSNLSQQLTGLTDCSAITAYTPNHMIKANGTGFELFNPSSLFVSKVDNETIEGEKLWAEEATFNDGFKVNNGFIFTGLTTTITIDDIDTSSAMTSVNNTTLASTASIKGYVDTLIFGTGTTSNFVTTDTVQTVTGEKTFESIIFNSGTTGSDFNIQADLTVTGNTFNDLTSYVYFGDETTDGSYRTSINPEGNLEVQYRSGGTWTWATNYGEDGIRAKRITITTGSTTDAPYFDNILTAGTLTYGTSDLASSYAIRSYFDTIFVSAGTLWNVVTPGTIEPVTGSMGLMMGAGISGTSMDIGTRVGSIGTYSMVQGSDSEASGTYSYASGYQTTASGYGSFAIGGRTQATSTFSFAQGSLTNATGSYAASFGGGTLASGNYSIAGGDASVASGNTSFAFGESVTAGGENSAALGGSNNSCLHDNSAIIGGQNITSQADDTVSFPAFDFGGTGAIITGITTGFPASNDNNALCTEGSIYTMNQVLIGAIQGNVDDIADNLTYIDAVSAVTTTNAGNIADNAADIGTIVLNFGSDIQSISADTIANTTYIDAVSAVTTANAGNISNNANNISTLSAATDDVTVSGAASKIGKKIFEITSWDMDGSPSKSITHGLTFSQIISAVAVVQNDTGTSKRLLCGSYDSADDYPNGDIYISSAGVLLTRSSQGDFIGSDWNSSTGHRGWLTVEYIIT